MLTLVPSPSATIRIRATGRLGAEDYDSFEPEFADEPKRRQVPISCVLDCPPDTLRAPHLLLDIRGFGPSTEDVN